MAKIQKSYSNRCNDTLKKKMWSKYISKGIGLSMMKYNPKSKLFKAYKNTSYCAETLLVENGKAKTTYCKNRWCQTCNRIKTAMMIKGYAPQIEKLFNPVFVTLTLPTCKGSELKTRIEEMESVWRYIYKKTKSVKFNRTYPNFKGVRKAEITIRPRGLYHYHFHFIVDGWSQGEWLIAQWLKKFPEASPKAQDLRVVDEFGKFEIFKYAIKSEVKTTNTNAKRYDLVFNILRGKRTFSTFGGLRKITEEFEDEELNAQENTDKADGIYKWIKIDWFHKLTNQPLVDLPIPQKVKNMVNYPDEEIEKNSSFFQINEEDLHEYYLSEHDIDTRKKGVETDIKAFDYCYKFDNDILLADDLHDIELEYIYDEKIIKRIKDLQKEWEEFNK